MKIETGFFICLSELLNLHVGLMDYINPFKSVKLAGSKLSLESSRRLLSKKLNSNVY